MSEKIADGDKAPRTAFKAQPTIYDIARATGFNPSTVSRALSNPGRVSAKTAQRIKDAASAMDYRINPMARALPTGMTNTVGLVMSDITNPVYFDLIRGAGRAAEAAGYTLVLAESQESPELEAQTVHKLLACADGLVLVGTRLQESDIHTSAARKPVVLVNRAVPGLTSVVPDAAPGIRQALDHLYYLGHCTAAFLSGPPNSWMNTLRWNVIQEEARNRGISVIRIGSGEPTVEGGRKGLPQIRETGASAVLAYNDLMAIGLLTACQAEGISVPDELSIVGFDDIFGSAFTYPQLTTVRTPLGTAGEYAVRRLVESLRDGDESAPIELMTELVVRGSTGQSSVKARR